MGALLGEEDLLDGLRIEGVGAEAVDGFGGEGEEVAAFEDGDGEGQVAGVGGVEMEGFGHVLLVYGNGWSWHGRERSRLARYPGPIHSASLRTDSGHPVCSNIGLVMG